MRTLLTSQTRQILPIASGDYREDAFLSPQDVLSCGISAGDYAILSVLNVLPEGPVWEAAIRINADVEMPPGQDALKLNSAFFEELRLCPGQEWELSSARETRPLQELMLEPFPLHSFSKDELAGLRKISFEGRCLYVVLGGTLENLSLRINKQKLLRVRETIPNTRDLTGTTVLHIAPDTRITICVPARQGGTDLVVILDVSESMRLKDFEERQGRVVTRAEAAREVVRQILEWHSSGSASEDRFALVAFGRDARTVYPEAREELAEITPHQIDALCNKLTDQKNRVDITGSDIIGAVNSAAKLLDNSPARGSDATFIIVSDGAFWSGRRGGAAQYTNQKNMITDYIGRLYEERKVSIHTVTVGKEEWTRRYEQGRYDDDMTRPEGRRGHVPNPALLGLIANLANGKSVTAQDLRGLRDLFQERSTGALINLLE